MTFASIRVRLTAWYFCSLALILTLFAVGAWFAMANSILEAVDHDLRLRIGDVQEFIGRQQAKVPGDLKDDFQEQASFGLGGGLLEVRDGDGRVLYRSARLGEVSLGRPSAANSRISYSTQRLGGPWARVATRAIDLHGRRFIVDVAEPLHEFRESRERFETTLLILAPIALLLAALGGFWISGRALAPVARITNEARSISIANLSTRLETPPVKDELQRLTLTLNEMLERIDGAVKRMVQFTADASHELRAPLTLIQTAAEFSLRRERTRDDLVEAMRKIVRESGRTSRLVENLLLLARADSGADALRLTPTDICASARSAAEQAMTLAEPKGIRVSANISAGPILVDGDDQALSRLWLILLDNAVKYTSEGGQIGFTVRPVDGDAEVIVEDTGVGIAAAEIPHIFDRFWRADKVRSRSLGGAGLGLSIAQSIVERHYGTIEAHSELGMGSQFVTRLPLRTGSQVDDRMPSLVATDERNERFL